jgi:hypothetical protein
MAGAKKLLPVVSQKPLTQFHSMSGPNTGTLTTQVQQRTRSVLETLQLFIQQNKFSKAEPDQAWVSLCQVYFV